MKIKHPNSPITTMPLVLLDTGAQVTCLQSTVFEQLKIPYYFLRPTVTNIAAANGSPLQVLGVINLNMDCYCYKVECQGFKSVPFHVIKGLSEQVLLSNQHCQQLGLVTIKDDNQMFPTTATEHPGSFKTLISRWGLELTPGS